MKKHSFSVEALGRLILGGKSVRRDNRLIGQAFKFTIRQSAWQNAHESIWDISKTTAKGKVFDTFAMIMANVEIDTKLS